MRVARPVLHGRDHAPGGTDEIPGLATGTVEEITSDGGTIVVTNPSGPITNLEASSFGTSSDNGYVAVADQKSSGTDGGTFTSGAWQTRTVNTEISDASALCTLASNRITLQPGTYRCFITAPAYNVDGHQIRLYNVSEGTVILTGTTEYSPSLLDSAVSRSVIVGEFTILGLRLLEIQHKCATTAASSGFGLAASFGTEEYTVATFWATNITYANSTTYTSSGSFTVPTGVTSVDVTCWGGGGGGWGGGNGGGGGGGAYSRRFTVPVTAGSSYSVTVGAAGAAGSGTGGTSSFTGDSSTTCSAVGGVGGASEGNTTPGGAAGSCVGDVKWSGGLGGYGTTNHGGFGGAGAGSLADGDNGANGNVNSAGYVDLSVGVNGGGDGGYGGNSYPNIVEGDAAMTGHQPGGGGGGGGNGSSHPGKAGGAGQVIIGWNTP